MILNYSWKSGAETFRRRGAESGRRVASLLTLLLVVCPFALCQKRVVIPVLRPAADAGGKPAGREVKTGTRADGAPEAPPVAGSTLVEPAGGGASVSEAASAATRLSLPATPSLERLGITPGDALPLTLDEAIRRALEANNDIELARNDVRQAESILHAFEAVYDPILRLRQNFSNSVSPQSSTLGGSTNSGTVTRNEMVFDTSLVRPLKRGGAQYEVFFNNNRQTTDSTFSLANPIYLSSLGVNFTQPLLRDRAIDRSRRDIRVQRKRLEQSDADFRQRATEVVVSVQRAYWDLVFAIRNQQNRMSNLTLARENFSRIEAGIAVGAAAPFERAEVQVELANREAELLSAKQNVSVAENNLKQLILHDQLASEWATALLPIDSPDFDSEPVNLQGALEQARANRPEFQRLSLQEDINRIDKQFYKNQTRPRLDVQATISATGLAGSPVRGASSLPPQFVGGYGSALRNLASFDTRSAVVGVTVELPRGNKRAKAELASVQLEGERVQTTMRALELSVAVEVRNAAESVETLRQRVHIARAARESAEVQLKGERRLSELGRSPAFLLFQRENQLVNARNQEMQAEIDYNKALAEFHRSTGTILSLNNFVMLPTPAH